LKLKSLRGILTITPMKILNVIQRYHPARGGAEVFMQIVSEHLAKDKDIDVDVWTTDALDTEVLWDLEGETISKKEEKVNGVNVRRYSIDNHILNSNKYINKIFRVLFSRFPNWKIQNIATCPTLFGMLKDAKNLKEGAYDYVTVSSTPYYFLFYVGYLISKKLDIPYILMPALHTGVNQEDGIRRKYLKKSVVPFFKHSSKIVLNTEAEGKAIVDFCKENGVKLDKSKFIVTGQGVFLDKIMNGKGERFRDKYELEHPIVFQVGSKSYEKGSYNLVGAMKKVWDKGVRCHLVFAGLKNQDFSNYINSIEERYRKNILNIDNIPEDDKWDLYDAGDIFSMVSKTDSFGIVYLEAWAYKNPVLGCDNPAIREVVNDNEDGFLIDFDDRDQIAKRILYLLENENVRKEMGKNGYKKVKEKYDWDKNLSKLKAIYVD
jgi:glycosyltransferase involved in cell wall biosynthesis